MNSLKVALFLNKIKLIYLHTQCFSVLLYDIDTSIQQSFVCAQINGFKYSK